VPAPDEAPAALAPVEGEPVTEGPDLRPASRSEPEAIFIVGVSRSGTTLMRRILSSHSRIAIADENHYLGHLLPWEGARHRLRRAGDLRDDAAVRELVALIYSGDFQRGSRLREASPYWRWLVRRVPRADLEQRLLAAERTERGVFMALLRAYADRRHKAIMGEKTPAHVAWADTLLAWFPTARIVHMMRDPRAVFVSELRRRREHAVTVPYRWLLRVPPLLRGFVLLEVTWAWARAVAHHRDLSRRYPGSYRMVRFEDLVREPETTIDQLCAFVGVAPEPSMLRQRVVSRGSRVGEMGFDAGAADRWQTTIGTADARLLRSLLGRRIEELGYTRT
jgi:hypothetical protein